MLCYVILFDKHSSHVLPTTDQSLRILCVLQSPLDDILDLIEDQTGERDMLIQLTLGAMTDPMCQPLLAAMNPHPPTDIPVQGASALQEITPTEIYTQKARNLLTVVSKSPYRYYTDGQLFCMHALAESRQFDMAHHFQAGLLNVFNTLNLMNTVISSVDCGPLALFINHISEPCDNLILRGAIDGPSLDTVVRKGAYKGLTVISHITGEILCVISQAINNNPNLKYIRLVGHEYDCPTCDEWKGLKPLPNSSLQGLSLQSMIDDENVNVVCDKLLALQHLQALLLSVRELSDITPLAKLTHIQYLTLNIKGVVG